MADFVLSLGGVPFKKFEIPDEIAAGGGQSLQVHKYAGGTRTIDSFGPDDDAITWEGLFLDESATSRAQQIDQMRRQGVQVTLQWAAYSYEVVVKEFKFKFQKFYQIKYSISLEVVQDETFGGASASDIDSGDTDDNIDSCLSDLGGVVGT